MAEDVHRHDRADAPPALAIEDTLPSAIRDGVEPRGQGPRAEGEPIWIGVDEMREGSDVAGRGCRRGEGERGHQHLVARLDARGDERHVQRRRAVDDGDGAAGPADLGEHPLETIDVGAHRRDEGRGDRIGDIVRLATVEFGLVEAHRPVAIRRRSGRLRHDPAKPTRDVRRLEVRHRLR